MPPAFGQLARTSLGRAPDATRPDRSEGKEPPGRRGCGPRVLPRRERSREPRADGRDRFGLGSRETTSWIPAWIGSFETPRRLEVRQPSSS
jgi:hypothetical protein